MRLQVAKYLDLMVVCVHVFVVCICYRLVRVKWNFTTVKERQDQFTLQIAAVQIVMTCFCDMEPKYPHGIWMKSKGKQHMIFSVNMSRRQTHSISPSMKSQYV